MNLDRWTGIIGVIIGFVLGHFASYYEKVQRRRFHIAALRAEINLCERQARNYLTDPVAAPLYRLPTAAFSASFPAVLIDGGISRSAVEDLESFALFVHEINRGLDNVHRAVERNDNDAIAAEANRLRVKCDHFLNAFELHGEHCDAYVSRARRALER